MANFGMLLSFVVPEIILGVSLFLFFLFFLKDVVHLGTVAQILGLTTYQISYPVIVVRARLLSIGPEYEEAAMDLGGSPTQAVRRVLLPLLYPAIFASAALVFADTIDDFVTVRYLSGPASSEPLSVKIYDAARASPTPAVNAAATFMLVATLAAIVAALLIRRFLHARRAQRGQRDAGVHQHADVIRDRRGVVPRGPGPRQTSEGSPSIRASSASLVVSESTRSASGGKWMLTGSPVLVGQAPALVLDPRLKVLAVRQRQHQVHHRADVDDAVDHPGDAVVAASGLRLDAHALGPDHELDVAARVQVTLSGLERRRRRACTRHRPACVAPSDVACMRFETPRKSAT